MQDLILIRGMPGSGKTTLAEHIINSSGEQIAHHEADHFFNHVLSASDAGGPGKVEYLFNRRLLGAAHDLCYGNAFRSLSMGMSVIVSNSFTTRKEIERYSKGVYRSGLDVRLRVVKCVGEFQSVHGIPEAVLERMAGRWEHWDGETVVKPEDF
tara:strand:+ start:41968 stop:42429 length:462 start_codon:yes stop_codon:yes gene_type:complete